jgi:hypothetical protein
MLWVWTQGRAANYGTGYLHPGVTPERVDLRAGEGRRSENQKPEVRGSLKPEIKDREIVDRKIVDREIVDRGSTSAVPSDERVPSPTHTGRGKPEAE